MYNPSIQGIVVFVIGISLLLLLFVSFIVTIVYKYQQKQNAYNKGMEELKTKYENALLHSQLEIQEQTFQNISREIHDNIGQKLTLAKLHLNTLNFKDADAVAQKTNDSVALIGEAINDLSDISRSMSSEIVLNNGLIKALEFETRQLQKFGLYEISLDVTGNIIFLDANKELVLFRIVQEALNNVVKHSSASTIVIKLHFDHDKLILNIIDNGKGFLCEQNKRQATGLINMKKRANMLNGTCDINSSPGSGTNIKIEIPLHESQATL